jgi:hypothetical protein
MTKGKSPVCQACNRPIQTLLDIPRVSVDRVQCVRWLRRPTPEDATRRRRPRVEHDEKLSLGRQIATGDAVRDYLARLRALSGRMVSSSKLLPPWQSRIGVWDREPIPGAPRKEGWVVVFSTRWHGISLGAQVDVILGRQSGSRIVFCQHVGILARVWFRGHFNPETPRARAVPRGTK